MSASMISADEKRKIALEYKRMESARRYKESDEALRKCVWSVIEGLYMGHNVRPATLVKYGKHFARFDFRHRLMKLEERVASAEIESKIESPN